RVDEPLHDDVLHADGLPRSARDRGALRIDDHARPDAPGRLPPQELEPAPVRRSLLALRRRRVARGLLHRLPEDPVMDSWGLLTSCWRLDPLALAVTVAAAIAYLVPGRRFGVSPLPLVL